MQDEMNIKKIMKIQHRMNTQSNDGCDNYPKYTFFPLIFFCHLTFFFQFDHFHIELI
jgi:hypothetical protein